MYFICCIQGVVSDADSEQRILLQAVHELLDRQPTTVWEQPANRINRLVFIGECKQNKLISVTLDVYIYFHVVIC
jgi:hypothetical protein